ncbi:hypothetical protein SAMN04488002_1809 [Litoreibacter janthinus]|uniref:Uncharacterized protein n=1 Tax=Litoreibacter janthinus TaxID=670154 RepID=A0A1I6GPW4_9RHOB|nr:hypothetical protein SAMN04488002_1809 [Litoreibacter janthinus]
MNNGWPIIVEFGGNRSRLPARASVKVRFADEAGFCCFGLYVRSTFAMRSTNSALPFYCPLAVYSQMSVLFDENTNRWLFIEVSLL